MSTAYQHTVPHLTFSPYPAYASHKPAKAPNRAWLLPGPAQPTFPTQAYYRLPSTRSTSPPEHAESTTTGGASYSDSCAGSASETSPSGAAGLDLLDYMSDRLSATFDPLPLDRSLATQAQM